MVWQFMRDLRVCEPDEQIIADSPVIPWEQMQDGDAVFVATPYPQDYSSIYRMAKRRERYFNDGRSFEAALGHDERDRSGVWIVCGNLRPLRIMKVESIPQNQLSVRPHLYFPLEEMEPGQSFFVADEVALGGAVKNKVHNEKLRIDGPERHYCVRSVEGGVRVWRIDGMFPLERPSDYTPILSDLLTALRKDEYMTIPIASTEMLRKVKYIINNRNAGRQVKKRFVLVRDGATYKIGRVR